MNSPTGAAAPLQPGDPVRVGAYRLMGRLGAGGMGQVFLGVSRGGRKVAVKILRPELGTDSQFRARFAREVAAARTVNGFYTAPVVDADPDASPPWMVTAYVPGPSLAAAVAERGPFSESAVRDLAAALAEGLAAIHQGGLIHRDLKPANIILADDGPRIIDFGVARTVGTTTMTAKGTIFGTFIFMSPEQVLGTTVGPASDVFSLGSVLAFAATGRSPFGAEALPTVTHQILYQAPDLRGVPESLRGLLLGCLSKEWTQRLTLDDLLTRLAEPEVAVPLAAPVFASSVAPTPAPASAPAPAAETRTPAPGTFDRGAPSPYPSNPPLPSVLIGAAGWPVTEIAFSPDGRLLAGSSGQGSFWRVFVWDAVTHQLAGAPIDGRGATAPRVAFSPDGRLLILEEAAATRLLSLVTWQLVTLSAGGRPEHSWRKVRCSPNGHLLATISEVRRDSGFASAQICLWDSATLRPAASPIKVDSGADDATLAFSPDSRALLYGYESQLFFGDALADPPVLRKLKDLRGRPETTSFAGDGHLLAAQHAEGNNAVLVVDPAAQTPAATLNREREITRIEFSPVWPLLATAMMGAGSEAIDLWNLTAPVAAQSWPPPTAGQYTVSHIPLNGFQLPVGDLRFSPDGAFLAAASLARPGDMQALVRTWAVSNAQPGSALGLPGPVALMFSPDSRFLAISCPDQAIRLVSLRMAGQLSMFPGSSAAFSPSSEHLATTEPAGLRLWSLPAH